MTIFLPARAPELKTLPQTSKLNLRGLLLRPKRGREREGRGEEEETGETAILKIP